MYLKRFTVGTGSHGVDSEKSKSCCWPAGDPGKPQCQFQPESKSKGRRRHGQDQCPSLKTVKQKEQMIPYSAFLFQLGLQWIGCCLPTLRRAICLAQSTNSNTILFRKHPHSHTPKSCLNPCIWVPCCLLRLTQRISIT